MKPIKLETLLANIVHYCDLDDSRGASHFPIYNTATFDIKRQHGNEQIFDYSRTENPTRSVLETIFTKVENGNGCVCTNTGVGALGLLFEATLCAGDSILVENDCYGGTYRLLKVLRESNNIQTKYINFSDNEELENELKTGRYKLMLCESPTNPGLKIFDLTLIAKLAKKYNTLFAVDNSLATFASQRPIDFGADFSVFSTTKFISGHGSVIAGAVVAKEEQWTKKLKYISNAQGRAQSPFDVYLVTLGLPTLPYRMRVQQDSALKLATFLQNHKDVAQVKFPGLPEHPQYELAKKQMQIIPSVLTINMVSEQKANQLVKNTKLFGEKASFGTSDSRIGIPSQISHASFSEEDLAKIGLTKATVRISVGLEDPQDLIDDITNALL